MGEVAFAEGDRVLALRNRRIDHADQDGRHLLRNGNRGTVTAIDHQAGELTVRLDAGPAVVLPADYLADGHVAHGYAMTIHKAQGMTAQRTFTLASPDLARELGYVAASRHTDEARFYINTGNPDGLQRPDEPAFGDRLIYDDLKTALGVERAKQLALDQTEIDAKLGELSTTELLEIQDRGRTLLRTIPTQWQRARDAKAVQDAASSLSVAQQRLANAQADDPRVGWRDRHQRATPADRIAALEDSVDTLRRALAQRIDKAAEFDFDQWLERNEMEVIEATAADHELAVRRADAYWRATRTVALDTDPEIERRLGERPQNPADRERWERAAASQESYRLQYGELPDTNESASLTGRQVHDLRQALDLADKAQHPPSLYPADLGPDLGW